MISSHTDVVGSLLRPPELLQEQAGVGVVMDGEMRRLSFQESEFTVQTGSHTARSAIALVTPTPVPASKRTGRSNRFFEADLRNRTKFDLPV